MIWTVAAVHSLPVTLLDVVVAGFLANIARAAPTASSRRTTLLLCAWFLLLMALNGFHVATCVVVHARASGLLNRIGESVAVLLSAIPLVAFAYAFVDPTWRRTEARVVTAVVALVGVALSVTFTIESIVAGSGGLFYRPEVEHTEIGNIEWPTGQLLTGFVAASYALAAVVLVRSGFATRGRARRSAFMFAGVVMAAVVAVAVNRLEAVGALPLGAYTTWTLVAMLVAVFVYIDNSDEMLRFAERIVGIVLTLLLVVAGIAGELVVRMRAEREDAVRAVQVQAARVLFDAGRREDARAVGGARETGGKLLADLTIVERFVARDGENVELRFSYLARARAIEGVARAVALAMFLLTVVSVLTLRRLLETGVLAPLRRLERVDAASRAKSLFIAQLSHELRTPLSSVVGHARSLEGAGGLEPVQRERARNIAEAGEQLLMLVEGLLEEGKADFSSVIARAEPVEVAALFANVLALAGARAGANGVTILPEVAPGAETVVTDGRLLRQVLSNLLVNAVKHAPASRVRLVAERRDGCVRFVVEDTGAGIPPAEHARIFLPFHQVVKGDGAGLGLAIVKHFASALGSEVHVDSEVGAGARFWFDLPLDPHGDPHAAAPSGDPAAAPIELPDGAVRAELVELALVGDVVAVRERSRALAEADARYRGFAARVDALVDGYQVRALQAMLEGGDRRRERQQREETDGARGR